MCRHISYVVVCEKCNVVTSAAYLMRVGGGFYTTVPATNVTGKPSPDCHSGSVCSTLMLKVVCSEYICVLTSLYTMQKKGRFNVFFSSKILF